MTGFEPLVFEATALPTEPQPLPPGLLCCCGIMSRVDTRTPRVNQYTLFCPSVFELKMGNGNRKLIFWGPDCYKDMSIEGLLS